MRKNGTIGARAQRSQQSQRACKIRAARAERLRNLGGERKKKHSQHPVLLPLHPLTLPRRLLALKMMHRCYWLLVLRALLLGWSVVLAAGAKQEEWNGWKCDDMTPNLCDDLKVTMGSFSSRKELKVHFWRYASPNLDPTKFPVVIINGGPGVSHDYDLPLRQLACRGREVIFYDQGGTGESALPPNTTLADDYPFLMDVSYYAQEELPALIKELGLKKYHVVSDSWGTMIAMRSVIHKRDPNLLSLSLNGPIPKVSDYVDKAWDPMEGSIGTLPEYIKSRMHAIEASGGFESEEMQEIQMTVFTNFYSRNGLFADCAAKSFMTSNEEVAIGMWAAIDFFNITGTLKNFDLWDDIYNGALKDIPVLLTSGKYDVVRPVTVGALFDALPLSEKVVFPNSGHASVFDATGDLLNTVDSFLERVEFTETEEGISFVPKRPGEKEETAPQAVLQYVTAAVVVFVTFIVGVVVGQSRGNQNRAQYTEVV